MKPKGLQQEADALLLALTMLLAGLPKMSMEVIASKGGLQEVKVLTTLGRYSFYGQDSRRRK